MAVVAARPEAFANGGPVASVDGPWAAGPAFGLDMALPAEHAPPASRGSEQAGAPASSPSAGQGTTPLVRQAAEQVIAAIRQTGEGSLDLQLSPEELGRVRITLSPAEHGLAVAVHADRSDTLELLRRHIDSLAGAYRDIGYASLEFSFSGGDATPQGGAFAETAEGSVPEPSPVPEPALTRHAATAPAPGRLDLRF